MKESEIQANIVSALQFKGYLVYMNYQNVTLGSFRKGEMLQNVHAMHASLKKTGWTKGIPDLTVIGTESNGNRIRLYIECKSETGVLSANQKHMIRMLEVSGEEVRVVRSLDQIEDLLDKDIDIVRIETLLLDRDIEDARIAKEKEDAKQLEILKKKEAKALAKAEKKSKSKKIQKK